MLKIKHLAHLMLVLLDCIFLLYRLYLQNIKKIKIDNYIINQIFKFQIFVVLNLNYTLKKNIVMDEITINIWLQQNLTHMLKIYNLLVKILRYIIMLFIYLFVGVF